MQIVSVENPSPAKLAGLQADDIITAVDGETVANLGYQEAVSHVRGEADTSVELTIQRGKTELKNGSAAGNASHICLWNDAGK